jgi:hypothetical protein
MANYYGSIDLTELCNIVRNQPELVTEVQLKDGTMHKFIKVDVWEKEQADQFGNVAAIKVSCKKDKKIEGLRYYIANLKLSQRDTGATNQPQRQPAVTQGEGDDLPF